MYITLLPLCIVVNGLYRGLLRHNDEAECVCNVDFTSIIGVVVLAYIISSEYCCSYRDGSI